MSCVTKKINKFFRYALKKDIENVKTNIVLSERQLKIFEMFYIEKHDINFIADNLCVCRMVVNNELKLIRIKIAKILEID